MLCGATAEGTTIRKPQPQKHMQKKFLAQYASIKQQTKIIKRYFATPRVLHAPLAFFQQFTCSLLQDKIISQQIVNKYLNLHYLPLFRLCF